MAAELRSEDIGINFDFDFEKLSKVDNEVTRLIDRIEKIGGSFSGVTDNMRRFSNDFTGAFTKAQVSVEGFTKANGDAKRNIQEMNHSATTMRDKLSNLNNVYDSYSDSQTRNSHSATKAWQEQLSAIDRVRNGLRDLPKESVTKVKFDTESVNAGTKHIQNDLAKTDRAAEKTQSKFMSVKDVIAGSFAGAAISNGINVLVNGLHSAAEAGMEYNKEQDTMKTVWTSLTTEAPKDGKKLVSFINDMSQKTIYGADTLNEMAQSFYHVHSSEKETKNWTNDFVALGSTLHMSNDALAESGEQFAKIVAGGKASSEDMAVMINRFPMFGEALQQATGKSMKQLYAMSAAGKLSAKQFTDTLTFLGKKYQSGTSEAMTSAMGMSMYIKSRYQKLTGDVMRTSFKMSKDTSSAMTNLLSDKMMTKYANGISSALGTITSGAVKAIGYLDKHKKTIIDILSNGGKILGIASNEVWNTFGDTLHLIGTTFGLIEKNGKKSEDPLQTVDDLLKGIADHEQGIRNTAKAITGIIITSKVLGMVKSLGELVTMLGNVRKSTLEVAAAEEVATAAGEGATGKAAGGSLLNLFGAKGKHSGAGAHAAGTAVLDGTRTSRGAQYAKETTRAGRGTQFATGATRLERSAASASKLGKLSAKIPAVGKGTVALTALTALPDLFSMTKKTAGKSIGNYVGDVGGGLGGAAAGAALGSVIPGAGTAVGALIGGGLSIGGSILGSKLGSQAMGNAGGWIQSQFSGDKSKPTTKKKNTSKKSNPKPKGMFDSLPKDAESATKKATGLIKDANSNWVNITAAASAKGVKASKEYRQKYLNANSKDYDKAYKVLSGYTDKTNKSTEKSASLLVKNNLITEQQAQLRLNVDKSSNTRRLNAIKKTMNELQAAEKSGDSNRFALAQRLNGQILKLTDSGGQKQKKLIRNLNDSTTQLSSKQFKSILKQSRSAEKSTVASADKTYTAAKKGADKQYRNTKSAAAKMYGTSSDMYKRIVKKAADQRDKTVKAAKDQHDDTIDWAQKQHAAVVKEAKAQAGDITTIMGGVGDAVSTVLSQNALATGGKYSKPKSDDQSIMDNYNVNLGTPTKATVKNSNGISKSTKTGKVTKFAGAGASTNVFGNAAGGKISSPMMSIVGENGFEILQRGKKFQMIGEHGAELRHLKPGDEIYNHADARAMMSGSYGKRIPGFASGTAKAAPVSGTGSIVAAINRIAVLVRGIGRVNSKASAKTSQTATKGANAGVSTKGAKQKLAAFSSDSKKLWDNTTKDTRASTKKISKNSANDYDNSTKNMRSSLKQFNKQNDAIWDDTAKDTKSSTNAIYKQATNKVGDMSSDTTSEIKSMRKQFISIADDTATGFGNAFAKLGPYAHKGMASAITALNKGITGIDTTLAQFGGNKAVLSPVHYAAGSKGPIANDQLAVLNDATVGPRQELVVRDNKLLKPTGDDALVPLRKNDEVLNGSQVEKMKPFLPHFAKGTGVSDKRLVSLASKNAGNPKAAWTTDFTKNVGKGGDTDLSKGIKKTATGAASSVGTAWSGAMWKLINSTIQGGGNGSLSPHFGAGFTESSGYGRRSGEVSDFHKGIDFSAAMGTAIPAQYGGKVVEAGHAAGFGNWVVIQPSGMAVDTIYGHMKSYNVHAGDTVSAGQTIAHVGSEGQSTGPHVHYEIRQGLGGKSFNPDTYKGKRKDVKTSDKGLSGLVKKELGSTALKWISDKLGVSYGAGGGVMPSGSHKHWLEQAGFKPSELSAAAAIIGAESGWNPTIHNPNSSAYGIPQALPGSKMASAGSDWRTNPITQLKWMKSYVDGRYGGTNQALAFRKVHGWYKNGGRPIVGKWSVVGEDGPELFKADKPGTIIPHKQSKSLVAGATATHSGSTKVEINQKITIKADGVSGDLKQQVSTAMAQPNANIIDQLRQFFEPNDDGGLVI
ncbi:putative protein yqbO [Lactobacillus brevis KB290] [Lactiplantibacillus mudanjiangensis]|uniref:aggregation-promoting factor C-terminal-like domain-containing protein n=1 Tax=Lactiplantibacillus mudanjiangensis TaxID=1296538 RepID=UPI0010151BAC|nr:tape measure protein [Lactiplantibacillus mudanjiangensis]VDG32886.1 putative protein yqbO [Lactobacillus brevis KB290] [Lactiplantibacillus mudanjiangensis]